MSIHGSAAAFVNIKTSATVDYKAVSREIQKEDVTCNFLFFFFFPPHRASVVQRGRLVKSMSLVPRQDKVLLAVNPSALIKTSLTTRRETCTFNNTWPAHTHAPTHALITITRTIAQTTVTFFSVRFTGQMTVSSRSYHVASDAFVRQSLSFIPVSFPTFILSIF